MLSSGISFGAKEVRSTERCVENVMPVNLKTEEALLISSGFSETNVLLRSENEMVRPVVRCKKAQGNSDWLVYGKCNGEGNRSTIRK